MISTESFSRVDLLEVNPNSIGQLKTEGEAALNKSHLRFY